MSWQANGNPTPPPPPAPPPTPSPPSGPGRAIKAVLAGVLALLFAVLMGLAACQPGTPVPQESPHPLRTARQQAP